MRIVGLFLAKCCGNALFSTNWRGSPRWWRRKALISLGRSESVFREGTAERGGDRKCRDRAFLPNTFSSILCFWKPTSKHSPSVCCLLRVQRHFHTITNVTWDLPESSRPRQDGDDPARSLDIHINVANPMMLQKKRARRESKNNKIMSVGSDFWLRCGSWQSCWERSLGKGMQGSANH